MEWLASKYRVLDIYGGDAGEIGRDSVCRVGRVSHGEMCLSVVRAAYTHSHTERIESAAKARPFG